jgi:hypothetical protein
VIYARVTDGAPSGSPRGNAVAKEHTLGKWIAVASKGCRGLGITLIDGTITNVYEPMEIGEDYVAGSSSDKKVVDVAVTYHSIAKIRPIS